MSSALETDLQRLVVQTAPVCLTCLSSLAVIQCLAEAQRGSPAGQSRDGGPWGGRQGGWWAAQAGVHFLPHLPHLGRACPLLQTGLVPANWGDALVLRAYIMVVSWGPLREGTMERAMQTRDSVGTWARETDGARFGAGAVPSWRSMCWGHGGAKPAPAPHGAMQVLGGHERQ